MNSKNIYKRRLLVIILGALIVSGIYFLFSPVESAFFPKCPFHTFTGLDCPGCGSQRALHYLTHFDFKNAFLSNPLLIISIPYIFTGVYFEYFGGKEKYPQMRKTLFGKRAAVILFIIVVLFSVGRNLV